MGNCYNIDNKDQDILSDIEHLERINSEKNLSNLNMIENTKENNNSDINMISEQINKDIYYISKTLLKLTVKQSKNLQEGKEYIINSLGLLFNNKNKTKDGLTIFGDVNVIKYFYYFIINHNIVKYQNRFYFPRGRKQY